MDVIEALRRYGAHDAARDLESLAAGASASGSMAVIAALCRHGAHEADLVDVIEALRRDVAQDTAHDAESLAASASALGSKSTFAAVPALSNATSGADCIGPVTKESIDTLGKDKEEREERQQQRIYKEKMRKRKNSRRIQKAKKASREKAKKASRVRGAQEPLSAAGLGSAKHNEREQQTEQSVENIGMGVEAVQLKLREIGVLGEVCAKFLEEDIDVEGLSLLSHEDMRPWGLLKLVYFRKLQAFASEKMRIQVRGGAQEMAQGGEGGSMRTTTPKATNESGSAETPLSVKKKKKTKTKNTSAVRVALETSQRERMLARQERAQTTKARKNQ